MEDNKQVDDKALIDELKDYGFNEEKIKIALRFTKDKESVINLIIQMDEDSNFAEQMKQQVNMVQSNSIDQQSLNIDNYKMVIIVREDLQLSKGKTAAQVGHAVLGVYKRAMKSSPQIVQLWETYSGQAKIVLGVPNEKEMFDLKNKAEAKSLVTCLITDAGRTEIAPNTSTCCAIGPGKVEDINSITGHLKLLS